MNPEQFQRVRRLFDEALTLPAADRSGFLSGACPDDPQVRAEVERLLAQPTVDGTGMTAFPGITLDADVAPGNIVSHYRLEERIGAGGMGEVYRATDLALGRTAAVKVLGAGLTGPYRERLLLEAKMSARLQHPGIATFFEGGEADGVAFLAMEYVQGETLRSRLRRGAMEVESALRVTMALLEALAHAHEYDVVHRDIKPENVMRRADGLIKLLDFGIAKRVDTASLELDPEAAAQHEADPVGRPVESEIDSDSVTIDATRTVMADLTRRGSVIGTIGYMPPEQLRGEPIDARVDLFAVGAILYEAITGRPAIPGKTMSQRIAATLSDVIAPLNVPEAGPQLETVVRRALARDRDDRYPSVGEFLRDLQALVSGEVASIHPDTLAIVEFDNRGDEQDAWIGNAVSDSLAADLAGIEGLGILPREQVARARDAREDHDPVHIGLALGCRWVLDGAVQRMGPSIRITHRLLEVATGRVAHTGKTDGKYDDLFELQDRLAASVAEHLHLTMPERTTSLPEHNLDAHECYNRGRALALSLDRGRIDEAETLLMRAIEIEPDHADALAVLAMIHAPSRWLMSTDPAMLDRAIDFAERAVHVDPRHADAQVWLGYAYWRQGRIEEALGAFDRAVERFPRHPWAHYFAASAATEFGRFDLAVEHARQALSAGTPTGFHYTSLGWSLQARGDLVQALWALEKAVEFEARGGPRNTVGALTHVADCLLALGRVDEARRSVMESLESIERSDHAFRDAQRTNTLCTLARIALAQGDLEASKAAATQCIAHVHGRPRGSGLGFTLVTALAVMASIDADAKTYEKALHLYVNREKYDFNMFGLGAFQSRDALVSTAEALGRPEDVERIVAAAVPGGN